MQRELWGPGNMPPGMRARLLRQTTYLQYGVQKDYQGAKSTVGNSRETIEAGGKLSLKPPTASEEKYTEYVSDPATPVPYLPRPVTHTGWRTWLRIRL